MINKMRQVDPVHPVKKSEKVYILISDQVSGLLQSLFTDYIDIQPQYASVKNFSCRFWCSMKMVAQRLRTGSADLNRVLFPGSVQNQQKAHLVILAVSGSYVHSHYVKKRVSLVHFLG